MDDYTREMMDLKTLVTRTLEKKGVLAKIRARFFCGGKSDKLERVCRGFWWVIIALHFNSGNLLIFCAVAELRASVFEAIEEEDRVIEKDEGLPPALLGSCNDRAKQLHASPSGRLLTALVCEYLDWAQLNHTLKVYLPECNLQKDSWKAELKDFSSKNGYDLNRNGDSGPLLLDVLEGFLKFENLSQARGSGRRPQEMESSSSLESRNTRRPSSSTVAGGLPPLGRPVPVSQSSGKGLFYVYSKHTMYISILLLFPLADILANLDRRAGSSMSGYRKDEFNWRYDNDDLPEDVIRASAALENLQLDRKARNLTTSWRHGGDGVNEDDGRPDHM
ncbi:putative FGFR1 oncogene partner [Corchorus capsularis]|uniref:Putative FGFR1 oncogene partner n=1 Tax=Corchorus capsularis TaxID=210143 RepID=A0A1R3HGE8_COCAP|nr:putative FGFR1 oncogene partner [Corchorus capsularis]